METSGIRATALVLLGVVATVVLVGAPYAGAAFPGKNGKIAFALTPKDSDGEKIWVMNADGSGRKQLTRTAPCRGVNCYTRIDWTPAWSPNGAKIVFTSSRDGGGTYQVWVMKADGSGQKQLTRTRSIRQVYEANPTWSADGTKIAFTSRDGSSGADDVYVMNADGSARKRLTRLDGYGAASSPAWSPDGTKIAFGTVGAGAVIVMNADGSSQTPLYEGGGGVGDGGAAPSWSPDGARIVFVGPGKVGTAALWVMNADGSGQKQVTVNGPPRNKHYERPEFAQPSWSSDGKKIVFWRVERPKGINWPQISAISLMNPDGSGQKRISSVGDNPDWGRAARKR